VPLRTAKRGVDDEGVVANENAAHARVGCARRIDQPRFSTTRRLHVHARSSETRIRDRRAVESVA
jgi:hypothetical protein